MRPTTLMMSQKKPEQKQGTALSFADVIPSRLPAQCPHQCIFYGKATQGENPSFDIPQTVNPVDGTASVRGVNLFNKNAITSSYIQTTETGICVMNKYATETNYRFIFESGKTYYIHKDVVADTASGATGRLSLNTGSGYIMISGEGILDRIYVPTATISGTLLVYGSNSCNVYFNNLYIGTTPYKNYEPYQEPDTLTIPSLYGIEFHDGIHDNVSWVEDGVTHYAVADTYEPCVLVSGEYKSRLTQNVGKVDLGTLNWTPWGTDRMFTYLPSLIVQGSNNFKFNMFCPIYTVYSYADVTLHDSAIGGGATGNQAILVVKDIRYGQNTAAYKTAMSGTYLYYPSNASPVVTLGAPAFVSTKQGTTIINSSSAVKGQIKASVLKKRWY